MTGPDYSPTNKKTEILDYNSKQWNVAADYPFSSGDRLYSFLFIFDLFITFSIAYYATTSTEESVYIIGGYTDDSSTGRRTPIIAEYKNDQWFNVGNLHQSRNYHGVITSGGLTMVVGGTSADGNP